MARTIRDDTHRVVSVVRGTARIRFCQDDKQKDRDLNRDLNSPAAEEQVISWERFLPRQCIRVLLVENDDSTRHIVSALLRKCSYHVAEVADGLKAWEILKDKHYNFDLVLTEVLMPSLSGMGLLSKIMNTEIFKHVPVIMMSSHDSIGIVFKCMLKGAADFLVKPVRMNELRNLWQHVWRKHCSNSSGNGFENENPGRIRLGATSDNSASSNHATENPGNSPRTSDSSQKGSDTQSSCRKPEIGVETRRLQNQGEPLQTKNKSTLREVESKFEDYCSELAKVAALSSVNENGDAKDKLSGMEIKVTPSSQASFSTLNIWEASSFCCRSPCRENGTGSGSCKHDANIDSDHHYCNGEQNEPSNKVIDFIGAIATGPKYSYAVLEDNGYKENISSKDAKLPDGKSDDACNFGPMPLWELSLRRPQLSGWDEQEFQKRHVLNHSNASAFSRYGEKGIRLSCPRSGSFPAGLCISTRRDIICQTQSGSHGTCNGKEEDAEPPVVGVSEANGCAGHSSAREETVLSHPPVKVMPLPIPVGAMTFESLCGGYGTFLQPIFYSETGVSSWNPVSRPKAMEVNPFDQSDHKDIGLVHHLPAINSDHCDQDHHSNQFKEGTKDQRATNLEDPHGSGSNGSNEDTNVARNTGATLGTWNEDGFQGGNGRGVDCDQSARREAALTKFRLKRKDRCFEKKVRYHSRKKLAEQRPRLKGQFVRQAVVESTVMASETDE